MDIRETMEGLSIKVIPCLAVVHEMTVKEERIGLLLRQSHIGDRADFRVEALLGPDVILSNFTANTALPGSRSMNAHCDQSTVMPEPWTYTWAMNAIWCLHDVDETPGR